MNIQNYRLFNVCKSECEVSYHRKNAHAKHRKVLSVAQHHNFVTKMVDLNGFEPVALHTL